MRIAFMVLAWGIVLCVGLHTMALYERTPGDVGDPPQTLPATALSQRSGQSHLLLFAHPKCPCTRATISELSRLMARCTADFDTTVIFLKPDTTADNWERTDLWHAAQSIPEVDVICDRGGQLASLFAVKTSGTALLYDSDERLVFRGGITVSRGHEGDNAGAETIIALLDGRSGQLKSTAVFGCSLCEQRDIASQEMN